MAELLTSEGVGWGTKTKNTQTRKQDGLLETEMCASIQSRCYSNMECHQLQPHLLLPFSRHLCKEKHNFSKLSGEYSC